MTPQIFNVSDEDVVELQAKDVEFNTGKEVLMQMIDMHKLDTDTTFLQSPVFKAYEADVNAKRLAFDKAKDALVTKYIPKDISPQVKEWSLNYYTGELTAIL